MQEHLKHTIRQFIYRYWKFADSPLFLLFNAMYEFNSASWPWIKKYSPQKLYLLTHFCCEELLPYQGREIAVFNASQLAVYWLPGATHSGGGYVIPGEYHCIIQGHILKQPLQVRIMKNNENTLIQDINSTTLNYNSASPVLKGGFVTYRAIEKELHQLILIWLAQYGNVDDCQSLPLVDRLKLKKLMQHQIVMQECSPLIKEKIESLLASI